MKFVLAFYGTRGDVEPCVAVGRELRRRGHDVCMAVSPDLVGFAEAAGLAAVDYGPDVQAWLESTRNFWTYFFRNSGGSGMCSRFCANLGSPARGVGGR